MDGKAFVKNIRTFRISNGLTQTEIARRLFVTPQTVSKWENGTALPDLENLCSLAAVLHTTPDRLLGIGQNDENVYLGIDAGGTKTDLVLFREDGTVLRRKTVGGANPNACGLTAAADILSEGIGQITADYSVTGIYAGIAGITAGDNRERMRSILKKRFPGISFTLESDIENVIFSVRGAEKCIAVICGTGSVVFARDEGGLHRIGGYGYLFDGLGSGYDMGRDALTATFEADDGLRPQTELTRKVHEKLAGRPWDLLSELYAGGRDRIAAFSPIVFEATRAGDETAKEILHRNLSRLVRLIDHGAKTYDCGKSVICAGGNTKDPLFREFFEAKGISPVIPQVPPVYGACVRCLSIYGAKTEPEKFDKNFLQSLPN